MRAPFWIYAEDLVSGVAGPFNTMEAAETHLQFCKDRGDADPGRIMEEGDCITMEAMLSMMPAFDRTWTGAGA